MARGPSLVPVVPENRPFFGSQEVIGPKWPCWWFGIFFNEYWDILVRFSQLLSDFPQYLKLFGIIIISWDNYFPQ